MASVGDVIARAAAELVTALVGRAVDAIAGRRATVPPPVPRPSPVAPPSAVKLRPVRKPRDHHVWSSYDDAGELRARPRCVNCDCDMTGTNRFAACPGRPVARFA